VKTRDYQKKKQTIEKFIKKYGEVDHSIILNTVNIDYDTLMSILAELHKEGVIKKKVCCKYLLQISRFNSEAAKMIPAHHYIR
jgi:predicted transcriptional regulator